MATLTSGVPTRGKINFIYLCSYLYKMLPNYLRGAENGLNVQETEALSLVFSFQLFFLRICWKTSAQTGDTYRDVARAMINFAPGIAYA